MNPHLGMGDYYLEVARGYIPNSFAIHKFGLAEDIDTKISNYNWIDGGAIALQISSTAPADIGVPIQIQGLDENWDLKSVTVVLNGQSPVTIDGVWNRVFRGYNTGSSEFTGFIYVSDDGEGLTGGVAPPLTVRAIIHPENQQTQMAIFTVPEDYSLFITHGWASTTRKQAGAVVVQIFRRDFGGVFRVLHTLALNTSGTNSDHRPYQVPLRLNAKSDIIYRVTTISDNNIGVSCGFHAVLLPDGGR